MTNLKEITNRFGGLWRYPNLKDYFFLVNPYFPNSAILKELQNNFSSLATQYPSNLKHQNILASKLFNIHHENLVVCNGVSEIINILPDIFNGKFGVITPTFNEYINAIGKDRIYLSNVKNVSFKYSIKELYELSEHCKNIILINPDNPSANLIAKSELLVFLDFLKDKNKNLIIDESFIDFSDPDGVNKMLFQETILKYENLLIIKSIGKSYGVPGIRLGIVSSSSKALLLEITKRLCIWNINSIAETFLEIMPKYLNIFDDACRKMINEREIFYKELDTISFLTPFPSFSNYILCKISKKFTSVSLAEKLFNEGYIIKHLSEKIDKERGEYIRLSIRDRIDNKGLIQVLQKLD